MRNPITETNMSQQPDYIPMIEYLNSSFDKGVRTVKINVIANLEYYQKNFTDPYNATKIRTERLERLGFLKLRRGELTLIKRISIGGQS